jgi:acyl-CoA thioesterase
MKSITGYFTVLGLADEPFTYKVEKIRDGKNYCVRSVIVSQEEEGQICFTGLCSFKKSEPTFLNVQVPKKMQTKWKELLKGKDVEDLPISKNFKDLRFVLSLQRNIFTETAAQRSIRTANCLYNDNLPRYADVHFTI